MKYPDWFFKDYELVYLFFVNQHAASVEGERTYISILNLFSNLTRFEYNSVELFSSFQM